MSQPDKCESYYELRKALFPALISLEYSRTELNRWADEGRTAKVLFVGDSIIHGWMLLTKDMPGGYNWMTDELITDTVNTAIVGNTSCDLIARETHHVNPFKASFIMTDGGGNDFKYGADDRTIMKNMREFLLMVRAGNEDARIAYGAIPPTQIGYVNYHEVAVNEYMKQVVIPEIGNACFVRIYDFLSIDGKAGSRIKSEFSLDGIHFMPQVYIEYKNRVDAAFNAEDGMLLPDYLTCSTLR